MLNMTLKFDMIYKSLQFFSGFNYYGQFKCKYIFKYLLMLGLHVCVCVCVSMSVFLIKFFVRNMTLFDIY